jgi:SAM-dependent methyltransferase
MKEHETRRRLYALELREGTARFFHPRQSHCPWCASVSLSLQFRTVDLLQHKPGSFTLERCDACQHIFQNPRLNDIGLAFYYRDAYDGLGRERMAKQFARKQRTYRRRARAVSVFCTDPEDWLDVGAGHGHFCEAARAVFPRTRFDGLDSSDGIDDARLAGRIHCAFRAALPAMASAMKGSYDVVSMYHYLEHTTDPAEELRAARTLLRRGGYLVVEVPDASSRLSRWLGRFWLPWLQPQHLHFVPRANLVRRLEALGFTVREDSTTAHDPCDLAAAAWLALDNGMPRMDAPWHGSRPGRCRRMLRACLIVMAMPGLALLVAADRYLVAPLAARLRMSNAYRVIAQYMPDDHTPG